MNEEQGINDLLQPITSWIGAVVLVENAWISLRSQDVRVSQRFVACDRFERLGIRIVVFHESHGVEWIAPCQAYMVERAHTEGTCAVAHSSERKACGEIESARSTLHSVEKPRLNKPEVAVKELPNCEFT